MAGSSQAAEIDDVIAATLVSRFNGRSIQELCAMGGITLDDFTQSVAYREIVGRAEAKVTLRLLARRCWPLSVEQDLDPAGLDRLEWRCRSRGDWSSARSPHTAAPACKAPAGCRCCPGCRTPAAAPRMRKAPLAPNTFRWACEQKACQRE